MGTKVKLNAWVIFATSCLISLGSSASTPNDLLFEEQWALNNTPTTNTPNGTCSSKPEITDSTYSCSERLNGSILDVDINAPEGWEILSQSPTLNSDVVIGLIDTGIDYLHPDLAQNVWLNPGEALGIDVDNNGVDDGCENNDDADLNNYIDDCHGISTLVPQFLDPGMTQLNPAAGDPMDNATGHGTNMAGVMLASSNNQTNGFHGGVAGVAGLNTNVKVATCAAADLVTDAHITIPGLAGLFGTHDAIVACINYFNALKDSGINIVAVNGSGGASEIANLVFAYSSIRTKYLLNTPQMDNAISELGVRNIPLVVAAGNNRWDIDENPAKAYFPAASEQNNIISVAALNSNGDIAEFSSYGRWSVDVVAPGQKILSTNPREVITGDASVSDYIVTDGSSQATALVSGLIGVLASYPQTSGLSPLQVKRLLISSGSALAGDAATKTVSGRLVRLAENNGKGALSCNNQVFQRRVLPRASSQHILPGETVTLAVERFNCHQAATDTYLQVSITNSGETIALYDDGTGADVWAGDGIYSAQWTIPSDYSNINLNFGLDSATGVDDIIEIITPIIIDNTDDNTDHQGTWWSTIYRPNFYGSNYRIAYTSNSERTYSWLPSIVRAGFYEVSIRAPSHQNFASNAAITVNSIDSNNSTPIATTLSMDQTTNGGTWISLGTYWYEAGEYELKISNAGADGTVAADAVKLEWLSY